MGSWSYLVATIMKRLCAQSGLVDPASYAAHSLRRGFAASADTLGIPRSVVIEQGGWRDPATYDRYARSGAVRFNDLDVVGSRREERRRPGAVDALIAAHCHY